MPPNCIEISDDEKEKVPVVASPRPIRALALVADINTHIEETNSAIKTHKDDVAHLKKLLRSAEERLEKEQDRRLKLIEEKNEALNLGVTEMNVRSGLGNGVKVEVKHEVKHEPRTKIEELSQKETGREIRQQSIFLGVQIPFRSVGRSPSSKAIELNSTTPRPVSRKQAPSSSTIGKQTAPPPPPPPHPHTTQINGGWDDNNSDGNVSMGDCGSVGDNEQQSDARQEELASSLAQEKPLRTVPTRGRGWRGGGNAGRVVGSRGSLGSISAIPQNSKSFRRDTISLAIGGQTQHAWPTPDQNGDFAIKIVRYCCVRRELNWCLPSRPGDSENALMFSSRPAEWDGADFPLFIREQISDWKYYGDYRITECCTVSLREWRAFEETQKITWCKFMLTKKGVMGKRFREGLGRDDWGKVYDLFEKEDTDSCHLRITARRLKFVRYNRKIYDLLEETSINQQMPAIKKRKVTCAQPPETPSPPAQEDQIKDEPSDDDDLYSAPSVPGARRVSRALARVRSPTSASGRVRGNDRESSVEMWEKEPEPWTKPTEDNKVMFESDHRSGGKFDGNQLIRIYEPPHITNMPKFPTHKFSRRFLSRVLGGCEQAQECVISEAKKRTQIYPLGVYYCERAEWAPDLPARPGAHGVVYATHRGSSLVDFNYSSYPIFCRRRANEWEYCGEYQITRRSFVPGEWSRVAPVAKKSWSEGFAGKRGKWGITYMRNHGIITEDQVVTAQDVLKFIDDGLIQLECQVYRCIGYNREFYDVLSTAWEDNLKNKGPAMKKEMLDEED